MPDTIQVLWEHRALMEEFESAVRRLEETHAAAVGFFQTAVVLAGQLSD
jgi:hypothetical protein